MSSSEPKKPEVFAVSDKFKMTDIIIKSKIKEAVPELQVAGEVAEALNRKVENLLKEASERA